MTRHFLFLFSIILLLMSGCNGNSTPSEPTQSTKTTADTEVTSVVKEVPSSSMSTTAQSTSNATVSSANPTPPNQDFKSLVPNGWHILESKGKPAIAEGDLNKDGIPDITAVIEKTEATGDESPRSLMIAFGTGNGNYTLSIIADHVVLRAHEGGPHGDPFDDILIDRGSVVLSDFGGSRWKWSDKYRFRFQNNDWYLIGLTKTSYDGATAAVDEDDYNLLTGDFIQINTDSGSATPVITKGNRGPKTVLLWEFKAETAPTQAAIPENTSHDNDLYTPIINAYAALERNGYTSFDKNLIGDSLLAVRNGSTYNFGWNTQPSLMYAYYDINGDGSPELLIGADKSISGIYVLQNGTPVSVIQVEDRHDLRLLKDIDGNSIIADLWGHMGYATEFFYTIDGDRKLATLDKLITNGDDKKGDEFIGHFRAKDVLGKEVSITEEEYCSLIRKYGSTGYEPLEDTGKERMIDITWKPVDTKHSDDTTQNLGGLSARGISGLN